MILQGSLVCTKDKQMQCKGTGALLLFSVYERNGYFRIQHSSHLTLHCVLVNFIRNLTQFSFVRIPAKL